MQEQRDKTGATEPDHETSRSDDAGDGAHDGRRGAWSGLWSLRLLRYVGVPGMVGVHVAGILADAELLRVAVGAVGGAAACALAARLLLRHATGQIAEMLMVASCMSERSPPLQRLVVMERVLVGAAAAATAFALTGMPWASLLCTVAAVILLATHESSMRDQLPAADIMSLRERLASISPAGTPLSDVADEWGSTPVIGPPLRMLEPNAPQQIHRGALLVMGLLIVSGVGSTAAATNPGTRIMRRLDPGHDAHSEPAQHDESEPHTKRATGTAGHLSYAAICGSDPYPGLDSPTWASTELHALYLDGTMLDGVGAQIGGCVGPTRTLADSLDSAAYQVGTRGETTRSVGVACQRLGPAIFLGETAAVVQQLLDTGRVVCGSARVDVGNGDVQTINTAAGTFVAIRPTKRDGGGAAPVTILSPAASEAWLVQMRNHDAWLWPIESPSDARSVALQRSITDAAPVAVLHQSDASGPVDVELGSITVRHDRGGWHITLEHLLEWKPT